MEKKYLIWYTPFCAGGLGDRLLGLTTSLCIATELNRTFLVQIDELFSSPNLELNPEYTYTGNITITNYFLDNNHEQQRKMSDKIYDMWGNCVFMWSNQNLFQYMNVKNYLEKMGQAFSKLFTEIFKIKINGNDVSKTLSKKYANGIHIRTVDNPKGTESERNYIEKVLDRIGKLDGPVFICGDNPLIFDIASKMLEMEKNDGEIVHTASEKNYSLALLDLLTLSQCENVYMGWNSNFSRVSALLNPSRKFYLYEGPFENVREPANVENIANYFSQPNR